MAGTAAERLEAVGQGHLIRHAETLGEAAAEVFLRDAAGQPWEELQAAFRDEGPGAPPVLRPPMALTVKRQMAEGGLRRLLAAKGDALVREGRIATMLLAGGQGTRLGMKGPKGNFVLGPQTDRTLYRIHTERVVAASRLAGRPLPFVVLVSRATEAETRQALKDVERWGLEPGQLEIVVQDQLPALDVDGKALLAAPGELATAPDGHGGAFGALVRAGVLARLQAADIEVLTTFQVDNPLALPFDPVMLGWQVERKADAVSKAVARLPGEKVGVFARDVPGKTRVVEYSEFPDGGMPDELIMGSIALHAFHVPFLAKIAATGTPLPLHRAHKKVPHLDAEGRLVEPDAPNAYKFERFIFDLFPLGDRVEVHEVPREREFAPVKNADGVDSPATARALVEAEVRRFYTERNVPAPEPVTLDPLAMLESA